MTLKKRIRRAETQIRDIAKNGSGPLKPKELMEIRRDLNFMKSDVGVLFDMHQELDARVFELEANDDGKGRDKRDGKSPKPDGGQDRGVSSKHSSDVVSTGVRVSGSEESEGERKRDKVGGKT